MSPRSLSPDVKFLSRWSKAFSRPIGIVRSTVWMDLDIVETLRLYRDGITLAPTAASLHSAVPGGLLSVEPHGRRSPRLRSSDISDV